MERHCKYLRPDMAISDANDLFGWDAEFDSGGWFWTDKRKCVVNTGNDHMIVAVYDFYRFKRYRKLLDRPGVFESEIPTEDAHGNPINQW